MAARRRLVDEVGVEPGAELRELHERMLRQDPELRLPARAAPRRSATARPAVAPAGRRAAPVARARSPWISSALPDRRRGRALHRPAAAVFAFTRQDRATIGSHGHRGGAVGVIDAKATADHQRSTASASSPGRWPSARGSVWVADPKARAQWHGSDGSGNEVTDHRRRAQRRSGWPSVHGWLWVAGGDDGARGPGRPGRESHFCGASRSATALRGLARRLRSRLGGDGAGRRGRARSTWPRAAWPRRDPGRRPSGRAWRSATAPVWVAGEDSEIARADRPALERRRCDGIAVGGGPERRRRDGLGAVWVANRQDGTVSRIDPATDRVTDTGAGGARARRRWRSPTARCGSPTRTGAVLRIDPRTRAVHRRPMPTGSSPAGLAAVGGDVWATAAAPPAAHRGGRCGSAGGAIANLDQPDGRLEGYDSARDSSGPGLRRPARLSPGERRGRHAPGGEPGRRGCRILPTAVAATPSGCAPACASPTARPSTRATSAPRCSACWPSSESGRSVRVPAILRRRSKGRRAAGRSPKRCDLSRGIVTDDRTGTITLHLRRPDPDLLQYLAGGLSAVLPAATPPAPSLRRPIPGNRPLSRRADRRRTPHPVPQPILPPARRRASGRVRRPRSRCTVGHDDEGSGPRRRAPGSSTSPTRAGRHPKLRNSTLRTRVGVAAAVGSERVLTRVRVA